MKNKNKILKIEKNMQIKILNSKTRVIKPVIFNEYIYRCKRSKYYKKINILDF